MTTDDRPRLTDLRTEHRSCPVGLDRPPRFSWVLDTDRRGCVQRSHRVVVRRGAEVVWDSGEVAGDRGYEVAYGGPPLVALTRYAWTVTVHTTHGDAEASSWFVSGLPDESDWAGAAWLGREAEDGAAPLLRHEFTLDHAADPDPDAAAYLAVAAGGYAAVTLNGEPVADEVLSPGFTDYTRRVQYVVHDVTRLLRPGRNALGVELGRGFFGMRRPNTWDWHTAPWHGEPRVRLLLAVPGRGGAAPSVVTSSHAWRAVDGPVRDDDLYGGESHDDRYARAGFDLPGYDDTADTNTNTNTDTAGWSAATVLPAPAGRLEHQRQQPIRIIEELPTEEVTEPAPGVYVVRFPRVLAGWAAVRIPATAAGATVTVRYGEQLTAGGRPNYEDAFGHYSGRFQTDRFTVSGTGEGPGSWCEPRFTYKGFQYVELTGWPADAPPPSPADLVARLVRSDVAVTGTFACSDPELTRLHQLTVATVLNNLHGIPTDTPKYEKNGWTGDAMLGAEIFLRNLDIHELLAKWLQDVADTRPPGGHPQVIAPHGGWRLSWEPAPTWHSAFVLIPWWLHRHTGDLRVLRAHFDDMADYARFELGRSPGGIAMTTLGDWVSPETPPPGGNPEGEDRRVSATAYLYAMLTTLVRAAGVLGRTDEEAFFRARAAEVRAAFRDHFVDARTGRVSGADETGFRQTHHALALAFGLLDGAERTGAAALLDADLAERGDRLNTGALGTKYLLPVLTAHGHAARALAVARQPEFPGWGLWLRAGATTLWEHWDLGARSRGHYFLGTIDDWLFADVAGLSAGDPDADSLLVRPALTGLLDAASARLVTPRGPAAVAWRREHGELSLDVTVPSGATARVHLPVPGGDPTSVTESGRPLAEAEAVHLHGASAEDAEVVLTVPGGHYTFAAPA